MNIINNKIVDIDFQRMAEHPRLKENLAAAVVRGLSKGSLKHYFYDSTLKMKLSRAKFLGLALSIKDYIIKNFGDEKRIGIALPSGVAGNLVNIAVQMAGKVSVNLNFTMGTEAAEACLKKADVRVVFSSLILKSKLESRKIFFPWPDVFVDISKVLKGELDKKTIVKNILLSIFLSGESLIKLYNIPTEGGDREASIIFTSGSEGLPKAAVLTHKNIMGNCLQMEYTGILPKDEVLHGNLPLFHSFGQSIQVWYTSIFPHEIVAVASPLEVKENLDAMREGKSTVMISTPTFMRSYMKKYDGVSAKSLRIVIGGAEKTPDGFDKLWEEKFIGCKYKQGYGLTEASPVVSVNLPDDLPANEYRTYNTSTISGSVGQLFAGMQACVISQTTGDMLDIGETGILCLKGPNVFNGYLDEPKMNAEKFKDGWLITGDLAVLDKNAFIIIKGRISRFSKLGGEMVPHSFMEERITEILNLQDSDVQLIGISSCEDENKGEALVLVSAVDVDMNELRRKLVSSGVPNLWIPKTIKRVDAIPTLASGKLDIANLKKIACS